MGNPRPTFLRQDIWDRMTSEERDAIGILASNQPRLELLHRLQSALAERSSLQKLTRTLAEQVEALKTRAAAAERTVRSQEKALQVANTNVEDFGDLLLDLVEPTEDAEIEEPTESGRMDPRAGMVIGVRVTWNGKTTTALSENISRSGIRLLLLDPPKTTQKVHLELSIPNFPHVACEGVVRWIRRAPEGERSGCGVSFIDLDPEAGDAIGRFAEALLTESSTIHDWGPA